MYLCREIETGLICKIPLSSYSKCRTKNATVDLSTQMCVPSLYVPLPHLYERNSSCSLYRLVYQRVNNWHRKFFFKKPLCHVVLTYVTTTKLQWLSIHIARTFRKQSHVVCYSILIVQLYKVLDIIIRTAKCTCDESLSISIFLS